MRHDAHPKHDEDIGSSEPRGTRRRWPYVPALVAVVIWLVCCPSPPASVASARRLSPVLGRTALVVAVSGRVLVTSGRGRTSVLRKPGRLVPFGSTIDVGHGRVRLVTARDAAGHLQSGVFDGGAFVVTQERSGLTDLLLSRGRRRAEVCGARPSAGSGRAPQVSSPVVRLLHGHAHGRFRTIGRYAAGTVRGTMWTTADRCTGTAISDHLGDVESATRGAPLTFSLAPGYSVEYRCASQGLAPVSTGYCLALLSQDTTAIVNGRRLRFVAYALGLITKSSADHTDVCVRGPARRTCTPYPLAPPDRFGFRESIVGCVPDQGAGDYAISWHVNGVALGPPLTYHAPIRRLVLPCRAWLGQPSIGPSFASFGADLKRVSRYSLPTAATSTDLRVYLAPSGTAGEQPVRGIVYADSGGTPGALLAVSDELIFRSTDSPGWYDLKLPSRLNLTAGDYWLGVITGAQAAVADFAYAIVPGSRDYNLNSYTNGPSDPFGPISTDSAEMSLYLVYDVAGPRIALGRLIARAYIRPTSYRDPLSEMWR